MSLLKTDLVSKYEENPFTNKEAMGIVDGRRAVQWQ